MEDRRFCHGKGAEGSADTAKLAGRQEFLPDAVYICRAGKPLFSSEFGVVGDCGEFGFPKGFPEVFDRVGKRLAEDTSGCHLILMDELGFMENEAELFQEAVIETLKSGVPVLGVVKRRVLLFSTA